MSSKIKGNSSSDSLLEWQQILEPQETELIYTKKQLKNMTLKEVERCVAEIRLSKKILKDASEVDEFFDSFHFFMDDLTKLKLLSKYHRMANPRSFNNSLNSIDKKVDETVTNFLKRSNKDILDSIDDGIHNKQDLEEFALNEWFDSVKIYFHMMSDFNIELTYELARKNYKFLV